MQLSTGTLRASPSHPWPHPGSEILCRGGTGLHGGGGRRVSGGGGSLRGGGGSRRGGGGSRGSLFLGSFLCSLRLLLFLGGISSSSLVALGHSSLLGSLHRFLLLSGI